jgi:hypothetical protein
MRNFSAIARNLSLARASSRQNAGLSALDRGTRCAFPVGEDDIMAANTLRLPLAFAGHAAYLDVTHLQNGTWYVETKVDGRVLGWDRFMLRAQVDRYRARMQRWLAQAEAGERRLPSAA